MIGHKNLLTACFAALLALGLAACGTIGDDAPTAAIIDDDGADGALEAMSGDLAEAMASACDGGIASQACVEARNLVLVGAKDALETLEADKDTTLGQIEAAKTAIKDATTALTEAQTAWDTYQAMQPPTFNLKAMAAAIDSPAAFEADAVEGGMVTVKAGTPAVNTYAKATWPVPTIAGWAESVWERSRPSPTKDSVVVYTNIGAARDVQYNKYYVAADYDGGVMDDDATTNAGLTYKPRAGVSSVAADVDDADKPHVITFLADVKSASLLFDFAHGLTGPSQVISYMNPKIKGNFNGVSGTFTCVGDCSLESGLDGKLTSFGAEDDPSWMFTADSHDTVVSGVLLDADYLDFGYWVQTSADGTAYLVSAFFRGSSPWTGTMVDVTTATYKGGAAGLYTTRGGDGAVTAAGRFTATAELTADFAAAMFSIKGKINNFMDSGNLINDAWSVELRKADITDGAITDGKTTGGGMWNGQLYGRTQDVVPTGVAGDFTAVFNNGDLIGAFGAEIQKK